MKFPSSKDLRSWQGNGAYTRSLMPGGKTKLAQSQASDALSRGLVTMLGRGATEAQPRAQRPENCGLLGLRGASLLHVSIIGHEEQEQETEMKLRRLGLGAGSLLLKYSQEL